MRFNLRTLAILSAVGVVEILGLGAAQANAQWGRGRGPFGPRPFRRGYGVVYAPPVVVAPAPVIVTRPRYIYAPPTIIQRTYIRPAPLVETRVVQPPAYEEKRLIQPPPVVERRVVQPPAYEEKRVVQPPPVVERRVVQPPAYEETREVQSAPVVETTVEEPTTDLSPPPIPTPE